jgi:hypothetical protein
MATLKKFRVKKDMGGYSYPYTHMDLIFDDENKNLTEKLEEINKDINNLKNGGIGNVNDYATKEYVNNTIEKNQYNILENARLIGREETIITDISSYNPILGYITNSGTWGNIN